MHFVAFIFVAFCCVKHSYYSFPQHTRQCLHFVEITDPNSVFDPKTVHISWHCLRNDHCNFRALAPHIGLQFFDPLVRKSICAFTLINDLTTFLSKIVPYNLDTISSANPLAYFENEIKRKRGLQHFLQRQFLYFSLQLHGTLLRLSSHLFSKLSL